MYTKLTASILLATSQVAAANTIADASAVLQLVVNSPQLSQYYHFDVRPQRKPLRIHNQTPTKLVADGVTADGQVIKLVQKPDKLTLEITELVIENDVAKTTFRYKAEGVLGQATLCKANGTWKIDSLRVDEN